MSVVGPKHVLSAALARSLGTTVVTPDQPLPAGTEGVVVVADGPTLTHITAMDGHVWRRIAQEPLWHTISTFQRAWRVMHERGGRLVLIVPTVGIPGAAQLVPYTTALEGMRAMAKSAARQWAGHGVVVNTVAVPLALLDPASSTVDGHLTASAVGHDPRIIDSVVNTTKFLLRRENDHLIGQTIAIDGGSVMLP